MNVEELHAELGNLIRAGHRNTLVALSIDEEGNRFHGLYEVGDPLPMASERNAFEFVYDDVGEQMVTIPKDWDGDESLVVVLWP